MLAHLMRQALLLLAVVVAATACAGPASTLDPGGSGAERISHLTWLLIVVMAGVYLVVLAVLAKVMRRRAERPVRGGTGWALISVVGGGIVLPVVVITALAIVSVRSLADLTRAEAAGLTVDVVAQQYWWEFRYREGDGEPVITANELHLPVGRRVQIRLHSTDVIHSFWVPALQGKLDLVPGKVNVTWLRADRTGTYHGQCAEYCGMQHALMRMVVVAQEPSDFAQWLTAQRQPAMVGTDERAQRAAHLFLVHCASCHRVRGTSAFFGTLGPDLTHVASRSTLAAGTLPNNTRSLAGWIADPQRLKPGNLMPRAPLQTDELQAVVDYVNGLR
jgi:cytochrome c oxidase subunit 2